MRKKIPLFKTYISPLSVKRVEKVLQSGWLGTGPEVAKFEDVFRIMYGTPNAIMTTSCTAALHMACELLDVLPGSKVVTTPLTFVSTNLAIKMAGLVPIFADIDPNTGNLSPDKAHEAVGANTAAIMVVHYSGMPADIDELNSIANSFGVPLIQDAAHAMGAFYKRRFIGSTGEYICFSLNAKKNIPAGDGGVLVVPSDQEKDARRMRWFGITKDTYHREGEHYSWEYDVPYMGFKYDPTDIVAAIARSELSNARWYNSFRNKLVEIYRRELQSVPGITILDRPIDRKSSDHLMVILAEKRDDLGRKLNENDIDFGVHYKPNNCFGVFDGSEKLCRDTTPNAWEFYTKCLSLPLHMHLEDSDVEFICSIIKSGW